MKILLLNNNPVVNKLVTLSAQKTSNDLTAVESLDAVESKNYDLLIIDDALYDEGVMQELKDKTGFNKSLYICSKDAKVVDSFTKIIKKPFLPTDLVELFISFGKGANINSSNIDKIDVFNDENDEDDNFVNIDDFSELDNIIDDALESEDKAELNDIDLNEMHDKDMDLEDIDELDELDELDEDLLLDEDKDDGVLDKDELNEVKNLLDETDADDEILEDETLEDDDSLEFDDLELETADRDSKFDELDEDLGLEDDLELEDESSEKQHVEAEQKDEKIADDFDDLELDLSEEDDEKLDEKSDTLDEDLGFEDDEDDLELEDKSDEKTVDDFDDFELDSDKADNELEDLESQIQSAVEELSDEDLQSEIDGDILLDIGSLTSRDLKLAIGEKVNEKEVDEVQKNEDDFGLEEDFEEASSTLNFEEEKSALNSSENKGVEALKKLLKALANEDVAASLKGMKININITLGDE
ncbi:MAG: hypothetical protein A2513_10215 [Sulfurimonas sp. RIFOXYD12_FULL_33_39]|uniref:DNA topoisomerase IV n=1 Tax=Sulfurimonas sp. RIFOXYD12_FULL_33_39 TaxID=1802259 RepID=UPI0008CBDD61|nr:DNA topoisomerase IV [Sulfurimonas sp. RIFOXYD12_FULL_33_39]OHE09686.1 MAG: hypothetical protein A2513_10215 [Sulfurimonas sp. RIFOXYD12_FULL_33_39]